MMNMFSLLCLIGFPFALSIQNWPQVIPHLIKQAMTWPMAQNYCRTNHLDLYTITDPSDQQKLINAMNRKNYLLPVWTGLYNILDNWYWSYNHLPLKNITLRNFEPGYPDDYGLDVCGTIHRQGTWLPLDCYNNFPFICYDAGNSYANRFVCYVQATYNWFQAQTYCRTYHTDLATTTTTDDLTLAAKCVLQTNWNIAWFGLTRETWKWSDGNVPSYLPWAVKQPHNNYPFENCGIAQNGLLANTICSGANYFVCSAYLHRTQVLKLQVMSDVSVLDPAVQSTILDLIIQKLQENGMSVNTTVTWKVQPGGSIFYKKGNDNK
ncbi:putative C-type lectin domain family 20 member A [Tachysurus fulvidraco]|uniref:putative C-type lectin domain family 20 member A n=1 Tax=Tachysurus fulvidraco TaxID=1234273 RepID=UPI001FEF5551|nr:putative C-type lectin domain family 20 member A [Tachysurus fulvidraco]XP_047672492.1 putative C-type lectin domain family 20 member A [Tachysurus fulvidraco]